MYFKRYKGKLSTLVSDVSGCETLVAKSAIVTTIYCANWMRGVELKLDAYGYTKFKVLGSNGILYTVKDTFRPYAGRRRDNSIAYAQVH